MAAKKDDSLGRAPQRDGNATALGRRQMELMAHMHQQLFQQIEDVNQAWLDSIRRTKEAETDFTRRLGKCEDPAKAAELCAEWIRTRAAAFLAESQRFSSLWLDFYSTGMKAALGATVSDGGGADGGTAETSRATPASA